MSLYSRLSTSSPRGPPVLQVTAWSMRFDNLLSTCHCALLDTPFSFLRSTAALIPNVPERVHQQFHSNECDVRRPRQGPLYHRTVMLRASGTYQPDYSFPVAQPAASYELSRSYLHLHNHALIPHR